MKFGRYKILEELGSGGFGTVYKAEDEVLGRIVALKVLHPSLLIDQSFLARFRNEARLAAQLEHPNLIPVHDFSEIDGRYVITMAYMAGGSLKQLLAQEGKLSPERASQILEDVCQGLDYAHGKGIIHRDLKPGNILLDENGRARIGDLGFARVISDASSISMTASGTLVGTPAYMAPELWRNKPASVQTDIYSLGCILYEMLTGEVLFEGTSPAEVMTMHVIDGPQFRHKLPAGWHELLTNCLAKDPKDRYKDIKTIREAYDKLLTASRNDTGLVISKVDEEPTEKSQGKLRDLKPALDEEGVLTREPDAHQIPHFTNNIGAKEPYLQPKKEDIKKQALIAGIAILSIVLILLTFNLLNNRKRMAPIPVANETQTQIPNHTLKQTISHRATYTPTTLQSKTSTITPAEAPTQTPLPTLGIGSTMTREIDGMEMVYVPAGEFKLGFAPGHQVYLDSYWIDKYEVSNSQYALCVADGACTEPRQTKSWTRNSYYGNPDYDNYPVIYVNWNQAQSYCQWSGGKLPTEAQWEKAARGTDGRIYPWGNESPTCQLANFNNVNYQNSSFCVGDTSPVTDYNGGASPFGALNMAGNVWEWVYDWYDGDGYYNNVPTRNPSGSTSGISRVLRGGSWDFSIWYIRAPRFDYNLSNSYYNYGFRCAIQQP